MTALDVFHFLLGAFVLLLVLDAGAALLSAGRRRFRSKGFALRYRRVSAGASYPEDLHA